VAGKIAQDPPWSKEIQSTSSDRGNVGRHGEGRDRVKGSEMK
jgi:hypothetical protein